MQREIDRDTVIEARYVGTRGVKLWQQFNLNEINMIENGFLNEFKLAQANLQANIAAGRGNNFRYFGPGSGTSPLPIIPRHFNPTGDPNLPGSYGATNFAAAAFVNTLAIQGPAPGTFANTLLNTAGLRNNALRTVASGRPCQPISSSSTPTNWVGPSRSRTTDAPTMTRQCWNCAAACRRGCWCKAATHSPGRQPIYPSAAQWSSISRVRCGI